jgi:hypothetical protein
VPNDITEDHKLRFQAKRDHLGVSHLFHSFIVVLALKPSIYPESKIYLGRLGIRSPRFILDVYLFAIGFFEIIFLNVYKKGWTSLR